MWKAQTRAIKIAERECELTFSLSTWRGFEQATGKSLAHAAEPRYLIQLLVHMLGKDFDARWVGRLKLAESRSLMAVASEVLKANVKVMNPDPDDVRSAETPKGPMDWMDLAALAWFDLRVGPEYFDGMSPAFFYSLIRRFDEATERFFMASSIVASAVVNVHADPEKNEPLSPLVFSPTKLGTKARREMEIDKKKAIRAKILGLAKIIPGAVLGEGGLALLNAATKKG